MIVKSRKLNRLRNYDYTAQGYYYVTVCTQNRINYFGKIVDENMALNDNGKIVENCWLDLPNHYRNCRLDQYVIMPNHFHGIICIENNNVGNGLKPFPTESVNHGLSEFIRAFKTFSSHRINESNPDLHFQWQKSFYDRIIRNDMDLHRIRQYIVNNPMRWDNDSNNIDD